MDALVYYVQLLVEFFLMRISKIGKEGEGGGEIGITK